MLDSPVLSIWRISTDLELVNRETTSGTELHVVLDGRATDSWAQLVDWARGELCSLGDTGIATSLLLAGLFHRVSHNP